VLTHEVHETTLALSNALRADPELYQRTGALAHVVRHPGWASSRLDEQGRPIETIEAGTPNIRTAPLSWLVDRVSAHARCLRRVTVKGALQAKRTAPPLQNVRAVSERGEWPGIRALRGIVESPTLRPNGSVLQTAGYDAATGYLYLPSAEFPPVEDAPTHSDAVLAYARLAEVFCDFPYANAAHRSAVVAAVLTVIGRAAIGGSVPCFVFDATTKRSGKSLQTDVVSLIATGRMASRTSYPETDEELEKSLNAMAERGDTLAVFDNIARKFGSAALDKSITATDTVSFRVLGRSEMRTYPWRTVILASGNNMQFRGDMLARVLSARLESPLENPETRTGFKLGGEDALKDHVRQNRPALVHAALTLLRAFVVAGRPEQSGVPAWGGFAEWSRLIAHALVWVGAPDPQGARRGVSGEDDGEHAAERVIVEQWERLLARHNASLVGWTLKQAMNALYPARRTQDPQEPDGFDEMREAFEGLTNTKPGSQPATRPAGDVLRRLKGRPVNGKKLANVAAGGGIARWRVVPA
jgi:hypothetical protein